jgi:FdhD protein
MADPVQEFAIWRWRQQKVSQVRDQVVVEEPLEIRLSGEPFQVLLRLPGLEKELALGFLFTEGLIKGLDEVVSLHFCGSGTDPLLPPNVVDIRLKDPARQRQNRRHLEVAYSSCGLCAKEAVAEIRRWVPSVTSPLTLAPETLLGLMARLEENQKVYQATGGTHAVALASPDGNTFIFAEDIGRHNALDKVIGRGLWERRDFGQLVALLSGRASFEMVLKTARAGIPLLAAVSAPTTMAVELAREVHLTLAGFTRGERLNIYTHPQRLGIE